jgi:hypothetical protein
VTTGKRDDMGQARDASTAVTSSGHQLVAVFVMCRQVHSARVHSGVAGAVLFRLVADTCHEVVDVATWRSADPTHTATQQESIHIEFSTDTDTGASVVSGGSWAMASGSRT